MWRRKSVRDWLGEELVPEVHGRIPRAARTAYHGAIRERLNDVLPHDAPDRLARLKQYIDPEVASFVHHEASRVFLLVNCFIDGLFSFPKLRRLARQLKVLNSLLKVLHGIGV